MKKTVISLMALLAVLLSGNLALADDHGARLELARKIVSADSAGKMQNQVLAMMARQFSAMAQSRNPGKEKEVQALISEVFGKMSQRKDEINGKVAALYAEKYTLAELQQMIAFRNSPLGRKMDKTMPEIMRQSMIFGQKWGQKISAEVMQQLRQKASQRGLKL